MSRIDKYGPLTGGFRAPLNAAWNATSGPSGVTDLNRVIVVALNGSGKVIKATTGFFGTGAVWPAIRRKMLALRWTIMTNGEIAEAGCQAGHPGRDHSGGGDDLLLRCHGFSPGRYCAWCGREWFPCWHDCRGWSPRGPNRPVPGLRRDHMMDIKRQALQLNKRGFVVPDMVFPGLHSQTAMPGHELVDLRSLGHAARSSPVVRTDRSSTPTRTLVTRTADGA